MMSGVSPNKKLLTLPETVSLGVGTMIGAGIFALFGNISSLAGGYAWLAFLCAGAISSLTGYSYFKLSHVSHTDGGLAEYLYLGWKGGLISSALSLCYFFCITIVLGLVSKAFGHYTIELTGLSERWVNVFAVAIMLVFLAVNARGAKLVGQVEKVLVAFKLLVLIGFIAICSVYFDPAIYAVNQAAISFDFGNFINAVALANLSFAGFAVVANAGGSVQEGKGIIGKAVFIAIAIVGCIYVSLDISIFGNMTLASLEGAKDTALAQAAFPVLGHFGFTLLAITAIFSTSTNINANIRAASETALYMAKEGQASPAFARIVLGDGGSWAMLTTILLVIVMIFALDLSQIANVASLTFLLVHTFIPLGNVLNTDVSNDANRLVLWLAVLSNGGVMAYFSYHLLGKSNLELLVFGGVIVGAFLIQWINSLIYQTGNSG